MPGLDPFLPALTQPAYYCTNCGFWQRYFDVPPSCPLCLDSRHVVPSDGWRFLNVQEANTAYPIHWCEMEAGVWKFWNDPVDGIGAAGYFVVGDDGNFMFDSAAVYDDASLDHIERLGGVAVLAASHPHAYGALWQIQDRFEPELAIHPGDLEWTAALRVSWPFDDRVEVLPGIMLHHTAGHFDGHTVASIDRHRILMCGDALKFELDTADDRRALTISTHKAFVRGVPCTYDELRRYRDVFNRIDFVQTWTPFEQASNSGRREAIALIDRQLQSRPHPHQVDLASL